MVKRRDAEGRHGWTWQSQGAALTSRFDATVPRAKARTEGKANPKIAPYLPPLGSPKRSGFGSGRHDPKASSLPLSHPAAPSLGPTGIFAPSFASSLGTATPKQPRRSRACFSGFVEACESLSRVFFWCNYSSCLALSSFGTDLSTRQGRETNFPTVCCLEQASAQDPDCSGRQRTTKAPFPPNPNGTRTNGPLAA